MGYDQHLVSGRAAGAAPRLDEGRGEARADQSPHPSGTVPVAARVGHSIESSVDQIVLRLNAICKNATLDFAMSVGRLIIDDLYGGDLSVWRSRGPKDVSFRKLAQHPALPMSAGSLYRSVAIYEVCQRLSIPSWRHVSTTHVRRVLSLPAAAQDDLLKQAEIHRWPVRRLEGEIERFTMTHSVVDANRGGRKRRSPLRKMIDAIQKALGQSDDYLEIDDSVANSSPESVREIVEIMRRVAETCTKIEERLGVTSPSSGSERPPSPAPTDDD